MRQLKSVSSSHLVIHNSDCSVSKLSFMGGRFRNNLLVNDQQDADNSPENSGDSPLSGMFADRQMTSTSLPKRSKRGVQKRVISVPIKDIEGPRVKADSSPPSDSWAWRKYGQKPIKGSPYPRGYYRCSSSKGCPARKQVERSHVDPTKVLVTYSSEHNHPLPPSKRSTAAATAAAAAAASVATSVSTEVVSNSDDEKPAVLENQMPIDPDEIYGRFGEESTINPCEFKWFSELETTACTLIEMPILQGGCASDGAVIFSMREEDESLFGDLGELPECSVVFRQVKFERVEEEEGRPRNLAPWGGTTR